MTTIKLAFDRSARRIDADGRLHVDRSHISKATVNPYYGNEIPGYEELGLDPTKVYRLLRDPVELERGAPTFARLPILSKHVPVTVDSPQPDLVVGSIGSEVIFDSPYLDADICVWDANAIAGIETDKVRELSCAYRYIPVMEPGEFEGQPYDGRMTEIKGNHLALVEVGRAGSADSALPALVGPATRKNFKKEDVKSKLLALDTDLDPQQLDNVIDALLDVEQDPKPVETPMAAADQSPADKLRALLAGKVDDEVINEACALLPTAPAAADADPEEAGMKPEEVKAAMDGLRKELRDAAEAAREVRPVVGDVAMDSASDIYGFALDHMKVDRQGVEGVSALRALFKVAASANAASAPVHVAQDSAGLAAKFPGAARFRNA